MEKKSKRKFVAPELVSLSARPDGTPLHAICDHSGSGDFEACISVGNSADGACGSSGNTPASGCYDTGNSVISPP